jgi:hypothetical protein
MAQDWTSIRVTEAALADARESKRESESWNDYLQRCTENPPEVREFVPVDAVETNGGGMAAVDRQEDIREGITALEDRLVSIERTLEGLR